MLPKWKARPCLRCAACVGTCPAGSIHIGENGITINEQKCTGCGACISICPVAALEEGGP